MENKDIDQEALKKVLWHLKFRAYVAMVYGLVTLFALVGVLMGKEQAVIGCCVIAVTWVLATIVGEAAASYRILQDLRAAEKGG